MELAWQLEPRIFQSVALATLFFVFNIIFSMRLKQKIKEVRIMKNILKKIIDVVRSHKQITVIYIFFAVLAFSGSYLVLNYDPGTLAPNNTTTAVNSTSEYTSSETTSSLTDINSNSDVSKLNSTAPTVTTNSEQKEEFSTSNNNSQQTFSSQTSSKMHNNSSSATSSLDTSPSDAVLEHFGMTSSEFEEMVEALKTCKYCGQPKAGSHHRFIKDKNCPDCGEWVKGYTCHFCK